MATLTYLYKHPCVNKSICKGALMTNQRKTQHPEMIVQIGRCNPHHGESRLQFLHEVWSHNLRHQGHGPMFVSRLLSSEEKLFTHWLDIITNAFSLMGFCIWHYYKIVCPGYQVFLVKIELSNTSNFWLKKKCVWVCFDNANTEIISPSLKSC